MNAFQAQRRFRELRHKIKETQRDLRLALAQVKEARATVRPDGMAEWPAEDGARVVGPYDQLRAIIRADVAEDLTEIREARRERARIAALFGDCPAFIGAPHARQTIH